VFPRGAAGDLDLLREIGLKVFNAADVGWVEAMRRHLGGAPAKPPTW